MVMMMYARLGCRGGGQPLQRLFAQQLDAAPRAQAVPHSLQRGGQRARKLCACRVRGREGGVGKGRTGGGVGKGRTGSQGEGEAAW